MKEYTHEEIEQIKHNLPSDLKQALQSVDLMTELFKIMQEQKLHVDEAGDVADIVEATLAGILPAREFLSALTEVLEGETREHVLTVAEAINKRVFAKVHESLHKIDLESVGREKAGGENVLVPENLPVSQPRPTINITPEAKMTTPTSTPSSERDISYINRDPRVKMIPTDIKQRINSDPYKEPI